MEVKYESVLKAHWERLAPAFRATLEWAKGHQAQFRIATEFDIRGGLLDNAKRLLPLDAKMAMLALTHAHVVKR